jgi:hypothetical protein
VTPRGGVAEEAAKLLSAMEGWLRNASTEPSAAAAAGPGVVRDLFAHSEDHQCDSPCQICPICQLISAARKLRPDVVEHLAEAAGSVLLALRALAESAANAPPRDRDESAAEPASVVEHITIN